MDDIILKGYIQIKCSNPGRLKRKAWRKRWLVIEFPTCDTDEVRSSSILVRVYVSHHHENKGPPAFCIPILDVHALHRIQSRSQPYAFSIDGSSGELLAAGLTETDTQCWMFDIRTRIWDTHPLLYLRQDTSFTISLIDNVHSDIARLRGFYGIVHVDRAGGEIVLTEARSGEEQVRWRISSINRVFCPKTVCKRDKAKILVIITNRNKSNGEGIFTFYSEQAQDILKDIKCARSPKRKSLAAGGPSGSQSGNNSILKNPLTYLFKRDSSQAQKEKGGSVTKQEKGRRKVLEKSASMMEDFGRTEKITRQNKKELIKELKASKVGAKSSSLTRTRTNPDHLDTSYYSCDEVLYPTHVHNDDDDDDDDDDVVNDDDNAYDLLDITVEKVRSSDTPSPPPYPSPPDTNIKEILSSGQYYSFNKDSTYSPLVPVKGRRSEHETSAELLNIERSLYELSQRQQLVEPEGGSHSNVRNSFLSVDSGRPSSETYDTSNSSVSSSGTNHSNRLNSTASNCSGDSGTQLSLGSGEGAGTGGGGGSVLTNIQENSGSLSSSCATTLRPGSLRSRDSGHYGTSVTTTVEGSIRSDQDVPPPLPPRYATIRKSFTLPHNMAGSGGTESKIYDNPSNLSCQGNQVRSGQVRPRPSSLSVEKRQFLRSASQENSNRSISSMSTFCVTPSEEETSRSRSLQRGRVERLSRTSRSVSSDGGRLGGGRGQLSHSTPQDLDSGLLSGWRGRTWRSNDGLITPVSPASPARPVSRFQPQLCSRVPLRARRKPLTSSDSASSLNNPSPHRDPLRDLATVVMNERCNSIPRSCTTDVLYRTGSQPRPVLLLQPRPVSSRAHYSQHSVGEWAGNTSQSVQGTLERATVPPSSSCTTRSLENIINQARREALKERLAGDKKSVGEEIYLDMSRLNKSSDYLEMERLHHQATNCNDMD